MSEHDFSVYGPLGDLRLVVEAKAHPRPDSLWARDIWRRVRPSGIRTPVMLVTPTATYVWLAGGDPDRLPDIEYLNSDHGVPFEARLRRAGLSSDGMDAQVFELLVAQWLEGVARGEEDDVAPLQGSGVVELLRGGRIERAAA